MCGSSREDTYKLGTAESMPTQSRRNGPECGNDIADTTEYGTAESANIDIETRKMEPECGRSQAETNQYGTVGPVCVNTNTSVEKLSQCAELKNPSFET